MDGWVGMARVRKEGRWQLWLYCHKCTNRAEFIFDNGHCSCFACLSEPLKIEAAMLRMAEGAKA